MTWLAKAYESAPPTPFLLYLASSDDRPNEVDARVRLILFLQGSALYNLRMVREKLQASGVDEVLAYERAVVDGKVCIKT